MTLLGEIAGWAGGFQILRLTVKKRMRATLLAIRDELKHRRHDPIRAQGQWLTRVVCGYFNYHTVPGSLKLLSGFRKAICRSWRQALGDAVSEIGCNGLASGCSQITTYRAQRMHTRILRIASRHAPEAGAVCGNSARTDLCGGWQVTAIPTATG